MRDGHRSGRRIPSVAKVDVYALDGLRGAVWSGVHLRASVKDSWCLARFRQDFVMGAIARCQRLRDTALWQGTCDP